MRRVLAIALLSTTFAALISAQGPAAPVKLDVYPGAYELAEGMTARVTIRAASLVIRIGSGLRTRLTPVGQGAFTSEGADPFRVTFGDGPRGRPAQLHIVRATSKQTGRRITVPSGVLTRYAGTYPLSDTLAMNLSLEGDQLIAQATGASRHPLVPESATLFFVQDEASEDLAHLEFGSEPDGRAFVVFLQMGAAQKVYRK